LSQTCHFDNQNGYCIFFSSTSQSTFLEIFYLIILDVPEILKIRPLTSGMHIVFLITTFSECFNLMSFPNCTLDILKMCCFDNLDLYSAFWSCLISHLISHDSFNIIPIVVLEININMPWYSLLTTWILIVSFYLVQHPPPIFLECFNFITLAIYGILHFFLFNSSSKFRSCNSIYSRNCCSSRTNISSHSPK